MSCECVRACLCGRLFSDTHILKQCTLSSSCQKTTNEKGGLFKKKKKKVVVALIPYRFSVLNCTGYISMQISTNSSSVQG